MIRIKLEAEEQEEETPLPIENENNLNSNNVGGSTSDINDGNVSGTLKPPQRLPEKNVIIPKKKKKPKLDNSTTDSVAVGLKSIKTEPVESSLSLTTQLYNSLNIQSLLRQNRIQNGWTTKTEPIVPGNQQEVSLSLIPNLNFWETTSQQFRENENDRIKTLLSSLDTDSISDSGPISGVDPSPESSTSAAVAAPEETPLHNSTTDSVAVGSKSIKTEPAESPLSLTTELNNSLNLQSLLGQNQIQNVWATNEQSIPNGTRKQQFLLLLNIEPFVPTDNHHHQEVPSSLDQSLSLISNSNSEETTTTTNCDIERENNRIKTNLSMKFFGTNNNNNGSGSIQGGGIQNPAFSSVVVPLTIIGREKPSRTSLTSLEEKKALRNWRDRLRYHRKKPSPTPLLSLEERKALKNGKDRLRYLQQKANPKPVDPEVRAEKRRRNSEYRRKWRQQRMANATPEQLELTRSKERERARRQRENESEEQRQLRLERQKQYNQTVGKQRKELELIPEEREKERAIYRENYKKRKLIMMMEKNKKCLEESQIEESQSSTSMSSSMSSSMTNENNNGIEIGTTVTKPGPSMKLPRRTRCQRNLKSKKYLESDTDSDDSDSD